MQLIFEDEMKMKGFKNALEDGVKMNIWAYLALLPIRVIGQNVLMANPIL